MPINLEHAKKYVKFIPKAKNLFERNGNDLTNN